MVRNPRWRSGDVVASSYRIVRLLGHGGTSTLYLATDLKSDKDVILKSVHADLTSSVGVAKRIAESARLGMYIASEQVLRILATGVDERTELPFVVSEFAHGPTLASRLTTEQPLPREEATHVVRCVLEALVAAHTLHVVHGDLQPESVVLVPGTGALPQVKVQDFGLGLRSLAGTSEQGVAAALSPWSAPECASWNEPPTAAADVWSVGLIAFEAFTGKSYWQSVSVTKASVFEVMVEVLKSPLATASRRAAEYGRAELLPPGFDAWFAKCVVRDRERRFRDARLACGAFVAMRGDVGFVWDRRSRLLVGAMAGLLLIAAIVLIVSR